MADKELTREEQELLGWLVATEDNNPDHAPARFVTKDADQGLIRVMHPGIAGASGRAHQTFVRPVVLRSLRDKELIRMDEMSRNWEVYLTESGRRWRPAGKPHEHAVPAAAHDPEQGTGDVIYHGAGQSPPEAEGITRLPDDPRRIDEDAGQADRDIETATAEATGVRGARARRKLTEDQQTEVAERDAEQRTEVPSGAREAAEGEVAHPASPEDEGAPVIGEGR